MGQNGSKFPVSPERKLFWKDEKPYFCMPNELHYAKTPTNIWIVDHEILDYLILDQILPKLLLCHQKGYLREN